MAATSTAPTLEEIQALVSDLPATLPPIEPSPAVPGHIASIVDHTLLASNALPADIVQCCRDAVQLGTATVCVNSSMVAVAAKALQGSDVKPICTIGFPFGAGNLQGKVTETQAAKADGALEIDMVQNVGLLRAGGYQAVFDEIAAVALAAAPAKLKVILETCYLTRTYGSAAGPCFVGLTASHSLSQARRLQSPLCSLAKPALLL